MGNGGTLGGGANSRMRSELQAAPLGNVGMSIDFDRGVGGGAFGGTLIDCTVEANVGAYLGGGAFMASLVD
jgi:hypothetical protein